MEEVGPADDNDERGEKKQKTRQNMKAIESYSGAAFLQVKLNAALFMKRFGNAIQLTLIDYPRDMKRFLDVCPTCS